MPKRTNSFQQLIALIMFATKGSNFLIEESVLTPINPKTGSIRELDIVLTNKNNLSEKILIECRGHKRKQSVEWIDALVGKSQSIGYKKVIAVSKSGFSKQAILEAKERDIKTLTLEQALENDWKSLFSTLKLITVQKISVLSIKDIKIYDNKGTIFPIIDPRNVRIIKKKNKEWITISDLIKTDIKNVQKDFEERRAPNNGTRIIYTIPLNDFLFQYKGNEKKYYANKIEVQFDEFNDTFELPLEPYNMGDEKLLIGEINSKESRFRLVFNITSDREVLLAVEDNKNQLS